MESTTIERTVTGAEIINKVREIAAERPDFVYVNSRGDSAGCWYFVDKMPSCIFGHVMARLQLPFLHSWEGSGASSVLHYQMGIDLTAGQTFWVDAVQGAQDMGASWGEAVASADERYGHQL